MLIYTHIEISKPKNFLVSYKSQRTYWCANRVHSLCSAVVITNWLHAKWVVSVSTRTICSSTMFNFVVWGPEKSISLGVTFHLLCRDTRNFAFISRGKLNWVHGRIFDLRIHLKFLPPQYQHWSCRDYLTRYPLLDHVVETCGNGFNCPVNHSKRITALHATLEGWKSFYCWCI